ncbi:RDD family protein [Halomarina salina]|uniref:RDD family protein n=1 Tax=Halomarina salina TaxID=1872699 RepID=A0ABD5RNU9_9EURY|nr:RDD family protein [Halomarina salina]
MEGIERAIPDVRTDAGLRDRVVAFFVDVALVTLAAVVVAVALSVEQMNVAPAAVFWVVAWFTYVVAAQGRFGQTVGKHLVGVVVATTDGSACSYRRAALRELVRVGDLLSLNLVGSVVTVGRRRQRLGDLVAGTVVVPAKRTGGLRGGARTPRGRRADGGRRL